MKTPMVALAAVLAAGCASGGPPAVSRDAAPLFRLATLEAPVVPPAIALPESPNARDGVSIEVRFETSKGETILAPRITAFHGQRANVKVAHQTAYVADFDVERPYGEVIMNPVVAIVDEGVDLDMTARPSRGGVALAWRLQVARLRGPVGTMSIEVAPGRPVTIQLPTANRTEAEGVRTMEPGTWGLLARLPDGEGGTVSVTARVTPERLEFDSKTEQARDLALLDPAFYVPVARPKTEVDSLPARAEREALPEAPSGVLDLRAVSLVSDLPPGSVVETEAAAGLAGAVPLVPGAASFATALVPGARAACLLDERYVKDFDVTVPFDVADPIVGTCTSGLSAEVAKDGALDLRWTTTTWETYSTSLGGSGAFSLEFPDRRVQRARVIPGPSPRLVVLAALPDGKVAGVLVRFRPE